MWWKPTAKAFYCKTLYMDKAMHWPFNANSKHEKWINTGTTKVAILLWWAWSFSTIWNATKPSSYTIHTTAEYLQILYPQFKHTDNMLRINFNVFWFMLHSCFPKPRHFNIRTQNLLWKFTQRNILFAPYMSQITTGPKTTTHYSTI